MLVFVGLESTAGSIRLSRPAQIELEVNLLGTRSWSSDAAEFRFEVIELVSTNLADFDGVVSKVK